MKHGIFRRTFILYAVVMVLAVIFVEVYITSALRESYIANLKANLSVQINLISKSVSFMPKNLDGLCRELKKDTGVRVTVIGKEGRVIGDSDYYSPSMDNHLHRTEIEQALLFDAGVAIRYSDTLKYDFLYVAKKIGEGENIAGFIRLSMPLQEVDNAVNLLRLKIIVVVIAVLIALGMLSLFQTDHLRRLLKQITDFSRSLSRGEIDKRLFLGSAGEFNEIAENLTLMSVKLQGMMNTDEEERNRLNVILRSIPDALLIVDAKGVITLASSSAREFFGDIAFIGAQFVDVVRNHEFTGLVEEVRKTLASGSTEFRVDVPEEKYLKARVSPLFYGGQALSGFVAVFHDITQIEKLEQVRKDFVANVSHELKTPITAIRGFADTLLDGALDDKEHAAGFIRTIKSNSERINSLVDDLMTISKIELGVIRVEKTLIAVDDVFGNVMDLFADKAAAKNLSLTVSNTTSVSEINADKNRIIQILTNLVDNAIKFTETGGVVFGLGVEKEQLFLFVEDTGTGVPAKHLERLGERFYRVDPARSRKMGGTGLGLAIVKHLVRAHGWTMQIESTQGKGTKIKIYM
ncbi:MAG: sensor histidine kinase [Thermodesulfovibrionales bacterium]